MINRILCGSAVIALLAGPALAQADKPVTMDRPAATTAGSATPTDMSTDMKKSSDTMASAKPINSEAFMASQGTDQMLASDELIGTDVINAEKQKVGSVDDLVLNSDGKVVGVIISVGGFLGIGDKHVAVSWDKMQSRSSDGFVVGWSKDELKQAPEFKTAADIKSEQDAATRRAAAPAAPAGLGGTGATTAPASATR